MFPGKGKKVSRRSRHNRFRKPTKKSERGSAFLEAMHIGGLEAARGTKIRPACWLAGDDCILEEPENF